MRAVIVGSVVAALAVAGAGAYYLGSTEVPQEDSTARWGTAVDARRHGVQLIRGVEIGAGVEAEMVTVDFDLRDERWVLRGTARQADRRVPFFAALERRCEEPADPSCWGMREVMIDGRVIVVSMDEPTTTEMTDTAAKGAAATEASGTMASTAPPTAAAPGVEAGPPQQPPATAWRVVADAVNARTGPGTDNSVAFVLSPEVPLYLVREQDGWGLFGYEREGDTSERVWVFMDLVEQK